MHAQCSGGGRYIAVIFFQYALYMFPLKPVDGGRLFGKGGVGIAFIGLKGGQNITQPGGFTEVVIGAEFNRLNGGGDA